MKYVSPCSALLFLITAPGALAGDVLVTAYGTVTAVIGGVPAAPFAGVQAGDLVEFSVETAGPPNVNTPTFWDYETDLLSGGLTVGSAYLPVAPGLGGQVNLQNEAVDGVTLGAGLPFPFVTGVTAGLIDFTGGFMSSPDITQLIGQTMTSQFAGAAVLASSANPAIVQMEITRITFEQGTCTVLGANSCSAEDNSTGVPGATAACGSASAGQNDVTLTAYGLPPQVFGFFLGSQTQGFTALAGGSSGNLCLDGNIGRFVGPGQIQQSNQYGRFDLALDLTRLPTPTGLVTAQPGETWYFTSWHRDLDSGGLLTSNFTDRLEITFQ